jgi:hypothetical protein
MSERDICLNCKQKKCSGNCKQIREATSRENKGRKLTVKGETHTLGEWAEITGISYRTLKRRINEGKAGTEIIKPTRESKRSVKNGKLQTNSGTESMG